MHAKQQAAVAVAATEAKGIAAGRVVDAGSWRQVSTMARQTDAAVAEGF